ncbi:MAG: PQQ-dependent sugar dehydrogenase [Verrucomicrobiota bacterium]
MSFARLFIFMLMASTASAGLLPPSSPYVVTGGVVEGQAEDYHAKAAANGDQWLEAPTNAVVPAGVTFETATGTGNLFMQVQPDNGPGSVPYSGAGSGPSIDYYVQFTVPGTYRLYLRWDGHDGASDSIYAGITELADGVGGTNPDWYEDYNHTTSDFGQQNWDGSGEAEANVAAPAQNAMTFIVPGSGIYTLRIVGREDGVALDSFRIQLASMQDPNPVAVAGNNVVIGSDSFTYANGAIANRNGGTNWDFDNTTNNNAFIGYTHAAPSTWDAVFGTPTIATNKLTTQDSAAKREYGSPSEVNGSINQDGSSRYKAVYYRVQMTRAAGVTWSGISSYDFANERVFLGVAFDPNPSSGVREFTIGENGSTYTGIPVVDGQTYTLVAKMDFVNDKISLWVNPDLTQPETAPNAVRTYITDGWSSAIRLGSGGPAATTWDDVAVGTSWKALQRAYPQNIAATGPNQIVGVDNFDYGDGNILGHDSGTGFDFDNQNGDAFVGHTQVASNWDNVDGFPYIFSNRLATWNTSAKREFNATEANGTFGSAGTLQYKTLYYRFEMNRSAANVSWSGLSLYENNTERLMFGVPFALNPSSNRREVGIHNLGANQWSYTGMVPVAGLKYQIVAKVDYATGLASIYVNPDLTQGEPIPTATLAFTNATTALRFGSGGDSPTYWDKLVVATSWSAVQGITYPAATATSGTDLIIGGDTFTYADGPVALRKGGEHWDFQNTAPPAYSNDFSDWDVSFGSPVITTNKLTTWENGAIRQFNGVEAEGAINDAATSAFQSVYVRFEMSRGAGAAWSGMSLYDFGNERFLFGVPFAVNPTSGVREFAIHDLASGHTYSGIAPVDGQNYTIVAKLDLTADKLTMWVNPDLNLPEGSNTPVAHRPYTGGNWITGLRLASGGSAATTWDNVAAGTSWRSLQSAFGPPTAFPDTVTMRHTKKALLDVRRNDAGAGSVEIVTPPASGTASIDSSGRIFYHHTTGTPANDTLTYRLLGLNGQNSAPATVTFNFTSNLRIANTTSIVPLTAPATGLAVVDSTPGINFTAPSCFSTVPGSTDKVLVGERNGKIWLIPNIHAAAPTKQLFLDVAAVVNPRVTEDFEDDGNELGLKGVALHPNFATNRQFFVTYNFLINGAKYARVARFTAVNGNLDLGDAASEQPFVTQVNPSSIHNIDSCHFGPDGYLYWSAGDAGGLNDGNSNSQRIDKDFWAAIFRIDVDRLPGNLEPNAHSAIALNGGTAYYKVPANNPFVGATTFNGLTLTGTLRSEIYAIGFRNPWQFSWDPQAPNEMWGGEVGLDSWEEVNVITPGSNYGWGYFEGNAQGPRTSPPGGFSPTAPLWTYFHGGGALEGKSVTGGVVYRGTRYPTLTGKYIFGDFVSGHIWSLTRNGVNPPTVERITGEAGVVAFMLDPDPATGDILMLDYGDGKVRRITTQTVDTSFPAKLSDTGLFSDLSDLSFNPGIERYDINLPFWSDYARKSRWFMLPNDNDTFGYVEEGNWSLPTGALWIKHFDMDQTRGNPATGKRLETRLLVKNMTGSYGVSYRWNDAGTEAFLVDDGGADFDMNITISGTPTVQHWRIPSRSECLACHTAAGGHGLSFETRQLNRPGALGGASGNFLELMKNAGYLSNAPTQFHNLPKYTTPTDSSQTLETRARSWLAVNCSYCHQAGGTGIGAFDMRPELSLTQTTLVDAHVGNVQAAHHRAVVRGDNTASVIWNRLSASNGYTRMPPLATAVVDPEGVQVVMDWINSIAGRQSYAEWRLAQFGSSNSPQSDPNFDADGDGVSNRDEFLAMTHPLNGASIFKPDIAASSGNIAIQFPNLLGRLIRVQTTTDFSSWSIWDVVGNNGLPAAPSNPTRQFVAPLDGTRRFFRLSIEEQ